MDVLTAVTAVMVFVMVFGTLFLAVVMTSLNFPRWLAWPIVVLIVGISSAAAYGVVALIANGDEQIECVRGQPDVRCPMVESVRT